MKSLAVGYPPNLYSYGTGTIDTVDDVYILNNLLICFVISVLVYQRVVPHCKPSNPQMFLSHVLGSCLQIWAWIGSSLDGLSKPMFGGVLK